MQLATRRTARAKQSRRDGSIGIKAIPSSLDSFVLLIRKACI